MFKLTGVIKVIKEEVQVSSSFKKREFVITDSKSSMYPQDILFELAKDKCDMINAFMEGQEVEVSFNIRGRMWTSPQGEEKYFNTLDAWRIESVGSAPAQPSVQTTASTEAEDEDLPF